MKESPETIQMSVALSPDRVEQLRQFAGVRRVSQDEIIARALDLYFQTASDDSGAERAAWSNLSTEPLNRVWDNDEDAIYDNWRELYGVPAR
jgi:hypothetical protein